MRLWRHLALASALWLVPLTALADNGSFYVGGAFGANLPRDSEIDDDIIDDDVDLDAGFVGLGSVGYDFNSGFRAEVELGYRANDVDGITGTSGGSGDVDAATLMGNVLFDFNLGGRLKPYLGLGIGAARVDFDGVGPVGGTEIDDDDYGLAYQGIVGLSYALSDRLTLTVDYRYLEAPQLTYRTDSGLNVDANYRTHSVLAGLRFNFGAPPPPPVEPVQAPEPAPTPAPAPTVTPTTPEVPPVTVPRNFLVFFDWDKADLTPEAQTIVAAAADAARESGSSRIEATGHADRSGPVDYNLRLSERRAGALKAELVRLGIAESEIVIFARGENDPLVPTPDGVREPQNRRVEIVLR